VLVNNLVTAFGMMAVFAIVRFRNILRDTLDTTYILISLVIGMANWHLQVRQRSDWLRPGFHHPPLPVVRPFRDPSPIRPIVSMLWSRPTAEKTRA